MAQKAKLKQPTTADGDQMPSWREVFLYFLMLGFINVGGPVAQITMMYNHMVERRHWLSEDRFVKIMAFCHMLPGPEALQLAIYVGYLKRRLVGGIVAGLTFILPGAVVMIVLSWLYVTYGSLPQVNNVLYVLKPAVLGIIGAGILKLGRASIRNFFLAALLIGAFVGMRFAGINFLLILLLAGLINLLLEGWPTIRRTRATLPAMIGGLIVLPFADSRWFQMAWLFLKTGAWVIVAGVILGVPAALVVGRLLQNTFVRTESRDVLTLIVTVALLAIVALVASIVAARRATRVEPTTALRIE